MTSIIYLDKSGIDIKLDNNYIPIYDVAKW